MSSRRPICMRDNTNSSINHFVPFSQGLTRRSRSRRHDVVRYRRPWRIRVEQKEEEMPGDWCNIPQKYRETPFPLCPFPFRAPSTGLLLSLRPLVLSFLPSPSFFVPLSPHRRIMLLWWPVVTLLNYICSQWSVIAIRLLTLERSRIDVSIRLPTTDRPRVVIIHAG